MTTIAKAKTKEDHGKHVTRLARATARGQPDVSHPLHLRGLVLRILLVSCCTRLRALACSIGSPTYCLEHVSLSTINSQV